jgi:hypothetical protein
MEVENPDQRRTAHEAEWASRYSQLDAALAAATRAPAVDERFDQHVWSLVRADEAKALATQRMLRARLGAPWWLDSLNVVAIAATAAAVALALRASRPVVESAVVAFAYFEQPPESVRVLALVAGAAALWFGLRQVPFVRAFVRAWL